MSTVLVTGGAGFIGSCVVRTLIDVFPPPGCTRLDSLPIKFER